MDTQLLKKLGHMDQLAAARVMRSPSGDAELIDVYNAAGLRFTAAADRCLDLYDFFYKGINFAFHTKNGLHMMRHPNAEAFFEQWPGGMLYTCGLMNVGAACEDNGSHPIHGHIGMTPAQNVCVRQGWQGDAYTITVSGDTYETRLYGYHLALSRSITTTLNAKTVTITDTVTNLNGIDEEFMLLYHINFGYPLLDASSECVASHENISPCSDRSVSYRNMCGPGEEPPHQQFLFQTDAPRARAAVINPELGLGCFVEYDTVNLPYMQQWKHMAAHDYVVALEPCNCIGLGRNEERKNGTLRVLPAYESLTYTITLGVLDGADDIAAFKNLK